MILFDRCAISRSLDVEMRSDARLLAVEPIVFGRAAMGEQVDRALFSDNWRIRRGGRLVYADALRLDGPVAETLARPGVLGGALACATVLYVAPDAEARVEEMRALLEGPIEAGASAWDGLLTARIVAADGAALRTALTHLLIGFRDMALPRIWSM
jgi:urease accessory protein